MAENLTILPVLLLSVVLHEVAHGVVALWCGDSTARDMGRLTLNPIPHLDLVGSIIVPLFSLMSAGHVFIAWAKPVPVNPANFHNIRRDNILVSAAGPLTNFVVAGMCTTAFIILKLIFSMIDGGMSETAVDFINFLATMFHAGILLNIVLAIFNLIPVPPLDGSHILAAFLPQWAADRYRAVGFFGIFIIIILMSVPLVNRIFFVIIYILETPFELLIRLFT